MSDTNYTLLKLSVCNDIRDICDTFFTNSGVHYLGYGRAYQDGSIFDLSSKGEWVEHFYNEKYAGIGFTGKSFAPGYYSFNSGLDNLMPIHQFYTAAENFDMHHPIVIIYNNANYYEYFLLATKKENRNFYDYITTNKEIIELTLDCFKEQASNIISLAENNKLALPDIYENTFKINCDIESHNESIKNILESFGIPYDNYREISNYINNLQKESIMISQNISINKEHLKTILIQQLTELSK